MYKEKKEYFINNPAPEVNYCVSHTEITDMAEKFDLTKSFSDHVARAVFYKKALITLAKPLAHIFSISFQKCLLPDEWKENVIIPLSKGKQVSINNLRPVSLCKLSAKMLEKFMLQRIKTSITEELNDDQFGFREKSSTCTAIIKLLHTTKYSCCFYCGN